MNSEYQTPPPHHPDPLPSNSCSRLNTSLVRQTIFKMADKMVSAYQFAFVDNLPLLPDCLQISYMDYFNQALAQVLIWALSDNQDSHQNGHHLSVYSCGHSNIVIYHIISSKFHIGLLSSNNCSCLNMGFVR